MAEVLTFSPRQHQRRQHGRHRGASQKKGNPLTGAGDRVTARTGRCGDPPRVMRLSRKALAASAQKMSEGYRQGQTSRGIVSPQDASAYAVARSFQVVYADSKFALQFLDATPGQAYDLIASGTGPLKKALDERNAVLDAAHKAYADAWDFDARAMEKDLTRRFAAINAAVGDNISRMPGPPFGPS